MIQSIVLLAIGFIILIKGADILVDGASNLAANFKISKKLIGITIIAFGTSAPELAISINAITHGYTDILLGNVIGSNIINILLILGITSIIRPLKIKDITVKKEIPLLFLVSTLLVVLFLDTRLENGLINQITRSDGIVIIIFFSIFVYYLLSLLKENKKQKEAKPRINKLQSTLFIIGGLVAVIIGSDLVVSNASILASLLGVSERIISITIVALGTSLPELVTSIASARKGETDLLMGNIIGSNIFNICIVLGIPVALFGAVTPSSFKLLDLLMLILSSVILFIFAQSKKTISRYEGLVMLMLFALYYALVLVL